MRILVLAPQPFYIPRGTPIAVRALLTVLSENGHDCDAMVYTGGEDPQIPGVTLYRVPAPANMSPGFSVKKLIADAVMFPMVAWRLARGRYDLVIAVEESAFMALAWKPFFRVPYIYDVDSSIPEQISDKYDLPKWLKGFLDGAEARAARGSIGAITCCKALEDLVETYAPALPIQTLEDVTLIDWSAAETPPEDCQFNEPVLMYIGNLEGYQGVDLLIEGFAQAVKDGREARLVIIGGTDAHIAEHQALADRLGISDKVSLMGPRPVERIGEYLSQATIVASPRTQGRNTPMKVFSYLDSGAPLLATRLPTHTQVLDDEISQLVEPTADDMARGIRELLDDPALRDRLAANARARVQEEFTPDAYARKLTGFMQGSIAPKLNLA